MKLDTRVWTQTEREGGLSLGFPCIIQWHGPVRFALRTSATNEKQTVGARSPHRGWLGWLGARRVWESEECIESERNSAMIVGWGKWTARSWINHLCVAVEGLAAWDKSSAPIPQRQPSRLASKMASWIFLYYCCFPFTHAQTHTQAFLCWQDGVRQCAAPSLTWSTAPCRHPLSLQITRRRLNTGSRTD